MFYYLCLEYIDSWRVIRLDWKYLILFALCMMTDKIMLLEILALINDLLLIMIWS